MFVMCVDVVAAALGEEEGDGVGEEPKAPLFCFWSFFFLFFCR